MDECPDHLHTNERLDRRQVLVGCYTRYSASMRERWAWNLWAEGCFLGRCSSKDLTGTHVKRYAMAISARIGDDGRQSAQPTCRVREPETVERRHLCSLARIGDVTLR